VTHRGNRPYEDMMKISLFAQAPYRYLPGDFEQHHESVCGVPYSLTTPEGVYSSVRDFMDELMFGARSGFDAVAVTEHGQSSYDMVPNPDLVASAGSGLARGCCGGDMSTPQKYPSTRHYLHTTSDNRRRGRYAVQHDRNCRPELGFWHVR
jgi:hypothetical protein